MKRFQTPTSRNPVLERGRTEIEALVRCLLPETQKFFESPEGKKEFEEWRAKETENEGSV